MILAIDTATRVVSLALHDGEQIHAEMTWTTKNQQTVELMPAIKDLLTRSQLNTGDLIALAVSQGPGSFNGLRIGFSAAKGMAMALGLPMLAIPTLDVIAASQPASPYKLIDKLIAVVQAGRGRICAGSYRWQAGQWVSQHDVRIIGWQAVIEMAEHTAGINAGINTVIAGEIDAEGRAAIEIAIEIAAQAGKATIRMVGSAFRLRRAGFLAQLAWQRWREVGINNPLPDAATLTPIYLHQPGVPHP